MSALLAEGSVRACVCVCLRECVSLALSKEHVCILHKCGTKCPPPYTNPMTNRSKKNVLPHHQDLVTFFLPASALGSQFYPATGAVLLLSVLKKINEKR